MYFSEAGIMQKIKLFEYIFLQEETQMKQGSYFFVYKAFQIVHVQDFVCPG